jgi:hypothetical protein
VRGRTGENKEDVICRAGVGCSRRDPGSARCLTRCTGPTTPYPPAPPTGWSGPCSGYCPVPPVGPSKEELDQIAAAAKVLTNALTPLPKPPSGATLSPEIEKLINDASRILVTVVGGQTVTQRIPEPGPGEADDPRLPPTSTQNGGGRCRQDWQFYEERETAIWNGVPYERATGAMACVVTTRKAKHPSLGFAMFGLDTSQGMARCHLIGHKLNGSNSDLRNFVPCYQNPANNSWMYHNVEAKIKNQVESNNPVLMGVNVVYNGPDPLSYTIKVNAVAENGWTCTADIPNMNKLGASTSGYKFSGC